MAQARLKGLLLSFFSASNAWLADFAARVAKRDENPQPAVMAPEPHAETQPEPPPEPRQEGIEAMERVQTWPRDKLKHMVRLLASGMPILETSLQLGVSVEDVRFALKTLPDNIAGASRPGDWSGRKVARLLLGLSEGMAFADIAMDVGHTRGAVSCKARRLRKIGLPKARKDAQMASEAPPAAEEVSAASEQQPEDTFVGLPAPKRTEKLPPYGMRSILDMQCNSCRWPTGQNSTGQHLFCGRRREEGYSFCAVHALKGHTFALGGEAERDRVARKASGAGYT